MTSQEHFEALYSEHGAAVLAYARRRTSRASAEDVVAEVFMTAWRRLDDVPADARIWLLGVARRVLANQRRGQARREALRDRLHSESRHAAQATVSDGSGEERVLSALSQLSEKDREVLLLLGWEELSHRDAARVLGIRAGTFAVRLHRARGHFAQALAAHQRSTAQPAAESGQPMEVQ